MIMLSFFRVEGWSMYPTLSEGDYVVASRWFLGIRPGDVLVVDHPNYGRVIKRVLRVSRERGLSLSGDNTYASVVPEKLGWVKRRRVLGKHVLTVKQSRPQSCRAASP